MYEAFDSFLDVDTWHTGHAYDLERFNVALAKVVKMPAQRRSDGRLYDGSKRA